MEATAKAAVLMALMSTPASQPTVSPTTPTTQRYSYVQSINGKTYRVTYEEIETPAAPVVTQPVQQAYYAPTYAPQPMMPNFAPRMFRGNSSCPSCQ